jgi:hypothetical protein
MLITTSAKCNEASEHGRVENRARHGDLAAVDESPPAAGVAPRAVPYPAVPGRPQTEPLTWEVQSLSVINRTPAVRLYYTVATIVFLAIGLAVPVGTLFRWRQVDPSFQMVAIISWPGIVIWVAVLWWVTRPARRP